MEARRESGGSIPQPLGTIPRQEAVDAAAEGALVLVEDGTYEEAIEITTPGITLRGINRNTVVVDGGFERDNGVLIEADGVAVENLTVRHFVNNAVYWSEVDEGLGQRKTSIISVGRWIQAKGELEEYRGNLQIQVERAVDLLAVNNPERGGTK